MKFLEIPLYPELQAMPDAGEERGSAQANRFLRQVGSPSLAVYLPDKPCGTAVVICPGGGYGGVCVDKEGHDFARVLAGWGVAGAVLKYRLPGTAKPEPPLPLADAWRALRLARANAGAWGCDPARLGIMGFSAGGHLALMAALKPAPAAIAGDAADGCPARPNFMILGYPVAAARPPLMHAGSFVNLFGANAAADRLAAYSADLLVTAAAPPAFFVHADDDGGVSVSNSILMQERLAACGVPAELLRHPTGGHGFGMGPAAGFPQAPDWLPELRNWLRRRGLLPAANS